MRATAGIIRRLVGWRTASTAAAAGVAVRVGGRVSPPFPGHACFLGDVAEQVILEIDRWASGPRLGLLGQSAGIVVDEILAVHGFDDLSQPAVPVIPEVCVLIGPRSQALPKGHSPTVVVLVVGHESVGRGNRSRAACTIEV